MRVQIPPRAPLDAENALGEVARDASRGSVVSTSSAKVDEFLADWLDNDSSEIRLAQLVAPDTDIPVVAEP